MARNSATTREKTWRKKKNEKWMFWSVERGGGKKKRFPSKEKGGDRNNGQKTRGNLKKVRAWGRKEELLVWENEIKKRKAIRTPWRDGFKGKKKQKKYCENQEEGQRKEGEKTAARLGGGVRTKRPSAPLVGEG